MNKTNSAPDAQYPKGKSRLVIEYLAEALTCRQTPKSREKIGCAIRDAAKIFIWGLEIETGKELKSLPDEITDSVMHSPADAAKCIDDVVSRVTGLAVR
jgi:hypothetical protein